MLYYLLVCEALLVRLFCAQYLSHFIYFISGITQHRDFLIRSTTFMYLRFNSFFLNDNRRAVIFVVKKKVQGHKLLRLLKKTGLKPEQRQATLSNLGLKLHNTYKMPARPTTHDTHNRALATIVHTRTIASIQSAMSLFTNLIDTGEG